MANLTLRELKIEELTEQVISTRKVYYRNRDSRLMQVIKSDQQVRIGDIAFLRFYILGEQIE